MVTVHCRMLFKPDVEKLPQIHKLTRDWCAIHRKCDCILKSGIVYRKCDCIQTQFMEGVIVFGHHFSKVVPVTAPHAGAGEA